MRAVRFQRRKRPPSSRTIVHVFDDLVTRASGGFEAFAIENRDIAAAVADQLVLLQRGRLHRAGSGLWLGKTERRLSVLKGH
jgi:hypothetical protein